MKILNRIVRWTAAVIQHEGRQRHVKIAMPPLGLIEAPREVGMPIPKEKDSR